MEAGRPTEYKKEYIQKIQEYLADSQDEWDEFHKTRGDKSDSYERTVKVKLPSIEGFAKYIGVSRKSVYNWRDEHKDFAIALDEIDSEQKERVVNEGLAGNYSPVIAKLILSSNHGMKERVDETSDDKPISPFSDEQVDRIAQRLARRKATTGSASSEK